jgi:hypothetical protein
MALTNLTITVIEQLNCSVPGFARDGADWLDCIGNNLW